MMMMMMIDLPVVCII